MRCERPRAGGGWPRGRSGDPVPCARLTRWTQDCSCAGPSPGRAGLQEASGPPGPGGWPKCFQGLKTGPQACQPRPLGTVLPTRRGAQSQVEQRPPRSEALPPASLDRLDRRDSSPLRGDLSSPTVARGRGRTKSVPVGSKERGRSLPANRRAQRPGPGPRMRPPERFPDTGAGFRTLSVAGNPTKAALWSREGHFQRTIPDSPHRLAIKKALARSQHRCFKKRTDRRSWPTASWDIFSGQAPFGIQNLPGLPR